jgi:hypothetical protein
MFATEATAPRAVPRSRRRCDTWCRACRGRVRAGQIVAVLGADAATIDDNVQLLSRRRGKGHAQQHGMHPHSAVASLAQPSAQASNRTRGSRWREARATGHPHAGQTVQSRPYPPQAGATVRGPPSSRSMVPATRLFAVVFNAHSHTARRLYLGAHTSDRYERLLGVARLLMSMNYGPLC